MTKAALITFAFAISVAAHAVADDLKRDINVPGGDLATALQVLARQSGVEFISHAEQLKGFHTKGVSGTLSALDAATKLLEGTPLAVKDISGALLITMPTAPAPSATPSPRSTQLEISSHPALNGSSMHKPSIWERLRGAQADDGTTGSGGAAERAGTAPDGTPALHVEEVIVTAQKRAERLQDVPMSITAVSGEEITRKGVVSMRDYLSTVPSVTFRELGVGANQIIVRGIAVGASEQSTVSAYLGEVPLTNSVQSQATDIKLVDMERVEILRGPQGTFYGSGSMAGTVRNIPAAPNLQTLEGKISVGLATVEESDDEDSKLVGVLNLPVVEDQFAVRLAAYRIEHAGYVDLVSDPVIQARSLSTGSPVAIEEDVAGAIYSGGRATFLWQPSERLSFTLTQLKQELEQNERPNVSATLTGYRSTSLDTGDDKMTEDFDATNLVLEYDAGWATFLSSSTRIDGEQEDHADLGRLVANRGAEQRTDYFKEGLVQEIRLASRFQGPVQLTGGIYYEDLDFAIESEAEWTGNQALRPASLGPNALYLTQVDDRHVKQKAVFGEMSYTLSEPWNFLLGARWFDYERQDTLSRIFAGVPANTDVRAEESDVNLKAAINLKPDKDTLFYAQWAQGFRLGRGVLGAPAALCDVDGDGLLDFTNAPLDPRQVDSDRTFNYELGSKFGLFGNRVRINTAVFHIDWEDIPITIADTSATCSAIVTVNGGKARSRGVELETAANLADDFSLSFGTSYVDAEFRSNDVGRVGGRLPLSPKVNANLGIQYGLDLWSHESFVRADIAYVGSYLNDVAGVNPRSGDYTQINLRAGVSFKGFDVELYANNVTSEDAHTIFSTNAFRLHPRTVGVSLSKHFGAR